MQLPSNAADCAMFATLALSPSAVCLHTTCFRVLSLQPLGIPSGVSSTEVVH